MSVHNMLHSVRELALTRGARVALPFARLMGINSPVLFIRIVLGKNCHIRL